MAVFQYEFVVCVVLPNFDTGSAYRTYRIRIRRQLGLFGDELFDGGSSFHDV
jgi:hypothetical protein